MAAEYCLNKVYAISDLHVDHKENLEFIKSWSVDKYKKDALIVAGDVTDNLKLLEFTLRLLKRRFSAVFYVPGNHELWLRPKESCRDSLAKFRQILSMCSRLGVHIKPAKFHTHQDQHVWIVPLFSWYCTPEDDNSDTLYMSHPQLQENLRKSEAFWMDNHMCKWPGLNGKTKSKYFAAMNEPYIEQDYDGPVITFSHMVPRRELITPSDGDKEAVNKERHRRGLGDAPKWIPTMVGFNFTRYAGANVIDTQLRKMGSIIHVYGHQHRNRDRKIDGVHYISHCMGTVREQEEGLTYGLLDWQGPKLVWDTRTI